MKHKQTPIQRFLALSDAQKEAEYARLDKQDIGPGKPLSAGKRKLWARVQAKARRRGRPRLGTGAKTVAITMDPDLLAEADAYAKTHHLKRSQLIAEGVRLVMRRDRGAA